MGRALSLVLVLVACERAEGHAAAGALELDIRALLDATEEGPAASQAVIDAAVATEVERIRSVAIRERVVRDLALDEDPQLLGDDDSEGPSFSGASVPNAADRLGELVTVARREASLVIDVRARHPDPEQAVRICNALLGAAVEMRIESAQEDTVMRLEWLAAQLDALERDRDERTETMHAAPEGSPERARLADQLEDARRAHRRVHERIVALDLSRSERRSGLRVLSRCVSAHAR